MNEMLNARTTWDAVSPWHSSSKHGGHMILILISFALTIWNPFGASLHLLGLCVFSIRIKVILWVK